MSIIRIINRVVLGVFLMGVIFSAMADNIYDLPVKEVRGREYYYYEVKPKETEYSLCRRFSITREELLKYNPSQRDGLKAYATLYFPVDIFSPEIKRASTPSSENSVNVQGNVETESGEEVHSEDVQDTSVNEQENVSDISASGLSDVQEVKPEIEDNTVNTPDEVIAVDENARIASGDIVEPDTLTISLLLPFEADATSPSKQAQLYTEFYKGFLMAVENMSHSGTFLKLQVFDTAVDDASFEILLQDEAIATSDLFIGPESEARLTQLAGKATETDALVVNPFVVSDETFRSSASIVQTNIPRVEMYAAAIGEYLTRFPDATTIFLARIDGEADKIAFTGEMKERLDEAERPYKDIVYRGVLTVEDFAALSPEGKYVFVPVSGSKGEYGKFISGVRDFKNQVHEAGGTVNLFGFPEWTMLRGDQAEYLKELDAVIYSRFDASSSPLLSSVKSRYEKWYGEPWSDVEPNQALLGYDIGMFVIDALRKGEGNFFPAASSTMRGIQGAFIIQPVENGGYVNSALYIIEYGNGPQPVARVITVPITSVGNAR